MAPAGCHTHRHASRESYYKEHDLIHHNSSFITTSGHITSHDQSLQKQVRRPLIVVASFTWLQLGSSKNDFLPTNHHNVILSTSIYPSQGPFSSNPLQLKWERQTPASHLMQLVHVSRWNRSHVSVRVRLVRAASSHNTVEQEKTSRGK